MVCVCVCGGERDLNQEMGYSPCSGWVCTPPKEAGSQLKGASGPTSFVGYMSGSGGQGAFHQLFW